MTRTGASYIIAMLASAAKSQEIKSSVESAYGDKNMSCSLINSLIKAVKDVKFTKMTKKTAYVVVSVAAVV